MTFSRLQIWITTVLLLALNAPAQGQGSQKNSKVAEVEAHLTQKAIDYIKGRFPGMPVLVNMSVTPLRSNTSPVFREQVNDPLPFFSLATDNPQDAWDDPSKSVHDLIPRIQSVNARIALPDTIDDDDLYELRDTLYSNLGLIPGRDQIVFERRNWQVGEKGLSQEWMLFGGGVVALLLLGAFLIIRGSAGQIEKGLKSVAAANQEASGGAGGTAMMNLGGAPGGSGGADSEQHAAASNDIHFNDTLKIAKRIEELIVKLDNDEAFPDLDDMIEMERSAVEDPGFLGAILQEMPKDMQECLFRKSRDTSWLKAFFEHSPLTADSYQFVLRLSYRKREPDHKKWQEMLIALWRLGETLPDFIKTLSQRDALGILAWMPTEISVPTARKAFPGAWGILLRHDFKPDPLPGDQIADITQKALMKKPYNDIKTLDHYSHERGLLSYLRVCPLEEERDIYNASPDDASIRVVRPPFYVVFEASDEDRQELANQVDVQDWGVALFNTDRDLRSKITDFMPQKRKFLLIEVLKHCDRNRTSPERVGLAREKIGTLFAKYRQAKAEPDKNEKKRSDSRKGSSTAGKPEQAAGGRQQGGDGNAA
jgi:hypothetical protein